MINTLKNIIAISSLVTISSATTQTEALFPRQVTALAFGVFTGTLATFAFVAPYGIQKFQNASLDSLASEASQKNILLGISWTCTSIFGAQTFSCISNKLYPETQSVVQQLAQPNSAAQSGSDNDEK